MCCSCFSCTQYVHLYDVASESIDCVLDMTNGSGTKIPFTDFYNLALDHWDLMSEYFQWTSPNTSSGFAISSFQYWLIGKMLSGFRFASIRSS